jgi:hypothetical protein
MNITQSIKVTTLLMGISILQVAYAEKNIGMSGVANKNGGNSTFAGCIAGNAQTTLDVNNIRTTILTGGDQWWDANSNPRYEVPKGSGLHSIYAGALWMGGVDAGGNIKIAAQTYRQTGDDMWPGAINKTNVSIDASRCKFYDRHWKVTKAEVLDFIGGGAATKDIREWPGNGDVAYGEDQSLAPFFDNDQNGVYSSDAGDYPYYNFSGNYPNNVCNDYIFGDETLWWVINDVGEAHTATVDGGQIGVEIRCQGFAFKTNDEVNNMTFYKYQIINRGTSPLLNTYFGVWCDPDLGKATDDFVGCDVSLGLGYVYNGDADDDGGGAYGLNPPAAGIDFFQGPLADPLDGIDNNKDGVIDEPGEQIIMSKYLYYNNVNNTPDGNPSGAAHHYNYLQGIWGDGQVMSYGGDGRDPNNPPCNYMFPGLTDPDFPSTNWTEVTAGNTPEDRRFLQSAGKFTLQPGAVNYITTGVVWARTSTGGPEGSISLMKLADAKAQAIFDNCFQVLDGPNAPDLAIRELSNQIIITLQNYNDSAVELYSKIDPVIPEVVYQGNDTIYYTDEQRKYKFQGYILYQFKNATVTTADIGNPDKVRTVAEFQCDVADNISQLINHSYDDNLGYWIPQEKVKGANQGIKHVFNVTTDLFASGDPKLINNKQYYFTIISYAYNNFAPFVPTIGTATNYTQSTPFFQGRNNIKTYTAIPHLPSVENNGQSFGSDVGNSPIVTRYEGQGNCGMYLDMQQVSLNEAMTGPAYRTYFPTYQINRGPLGIRVYDPVLVTNNNFTLKFDGVADTSNWQILNTTTQRITNSERPIGILNQQILGYKDGSSFTSYGFTANLSKTAEPGSADAINNGFVGASISYVDETRQWITFLPNLPGDANENWIKSASYGTIDPQGVYEKILGGIWAPYKVAAKDKDWSVKWSNASMDAATSNLNLKNLASVDIVFTSDKSKWTRCVVLEACKVAANTQPAGSNVSQYSMRKSPSVDKDGNAATGPDNNDFATGMSWFPGYAINIETGERLNMAFSENSALDADMKWNPTSERYDALNTPVFGNMHYVYVFGHHMDTPTDGPRYDRGNFAATKLLTNSLTDKKHVLEDIMWCAIPLLKPGQTLLSNDLKIQLRVAKTFRQYDTRKDAFAGETLLPNTEYTVMTSAATYNGASVAVGSKFTTDATNLTFTGTGTVIGGPSQNSHNPYYAFTTAGLENKVSQTEVAKDAMELINIVPNPYYAFSKYEVNQLDNRVKITNLPSKCTISIFTLNGTLIRKFKRDTNVDNSAGSTTDVPNLSTSLDWDMKNTKGIPVASGMYIIHVDAPGLGEKILKFFCVMRPIDLDTF